MANRAKKIKDVEKRVMSFNEATPFVKALLYGANGKGKTRTAAAAPNPFVVDINEEGTTSVRSYDGHVFQAKSWEDFVYAYWYLKEGNHNYETVVIDTITQAQHLCMATVLKKAEDRDPNRPPKMPDRRAWGQTGEMMKEQILRYRNLPMNVVFVAQRRKDYEEDEEGTLTDFTWVPNVTPTIRGSLMDNVGIIGYVFKKQIRTVKGKGKKKKTTSKWKTCVLFGDHDNYETKDRTGSLKRIELEPTIHDLIKANLNHEE